MSGETQATGRGRKHRCGACGAVFYDLERELSACPKCDTPYETAAQMPRGEAARRRQPWSSKGARRPEPEAAPSEGPAADRSQEDIEGTPILDAPDDAEQADDADEADDAAEKGEAAENDDA